MKHQALINCASVHWFVLVIMRQCCLIQAGYVQCVCYLCCFYVSTGWMYWTRSTYWWRNGSEKSASGRWDQLHNLHFCFCTTQSDQSDDKLNIFSRTYRNRWSIKSADVSSRSARIVSGFTRKVRLNSPPLLPVTIPVWQPCNVYGRTPFGEAILTRS